MKYSISVLLLLAIASNCNGQIETPGRRPVSRPGITPGNPNSPQVPPRGSPAPNAPQAPPRGGPAPQAPPRGGPAPPNRPNAQQNPRQPSPPTGGRPPLAPQTPGSRPSPQQNPGRNPPGAAPNRPPTNPSQPGNPPANPNQPTTTARTTTATAATTQRPPNVNNPVPTDRPNSYPTAPTIAPPPQVHFPDPNVPQMPQLPPSFPGGRVGEGRMDTRCPRMADPRNPIHFAHEANCASFFRCGDNGFAFEHRCPNGLHWNAARTFCDMPGNAGCQNGAPMPRPQPLPVLPPTNNWNQPRGNPNPGYEHPIVIPMAPRT